MVRCERRRRPAASKLGLHPRLPVLAKPGILRGLALAASVPRIGDGWTAWSRPLDFNEAALVAWSLRGGKGIHRVPQGRRINSVAVNPSGTLIGVSMLSTVIGASAQEAVYVLRASDGKEIYRRYMPRYSDIKVLFPNDRQFAYSANRKMVVLRVPE